MPLTAAAAKRAQQTDMPAAFITNSQTLLLLLTIAVLVEKAESLLEFSNLFFGQLVSHGCFASKRNCLFGLWQSVLVAFVAPRYPS